MDMWAELMLRLVFVGVFCYPLPGLIRDWSSTQMLVRFISPVFVKSFSVLVIIVMIVGSLSILLGVYAQIGGILLCIYSMLGIRVHYMLAKSIQSLALPAGSSKRAVNVFQQSQSIGISGHLASAQENTVLAAVALMYAIIGSGVLSLTGQLW